jgi:glycosidase
MKGSKDVGDADIRRDFPGGWDTDTLTAFYAQDDARKRSKLGRTPEQESYFQFTKKVLNWRKNQAVIHNGTLVQYVPENNVYVYFRILGEKKIMVVLNNSTDAKSIATSRFVDEMDKFSIRAVPLKKEVLSDTFIDMSQKSLTIPGKTAWIIEL